MNDLQLFKRTRQKLTIYYAGVMGAILILLGFQSYQLTAYERQQAIDREIESIAGTIHDSLEAKLVNPSQILTIARELIPNLCAVDLPCDRDLPPTTQHLVGFLNQGRYYLILLNHEGKFVARSGILPIDIDRHRQAPNWMTISDRNHRYYRQFTTKIHTIEHRELGELRIGRNIDDISQSLASFAVILIASLPIALTIVGGAAWYLAGAAMQPIYQAYERQKIFTANVAHELRTPLATTQLILDEHISDRADLNPAFGEILANIHRQNSRLIRIVADLLLLARLDRAKVIDTDRICNLDEIVEDLVEEYSALVPDRQVCLEIAPIPRPIAIKGDVDSITRLVSNVLENATKYTPVGGKISLAITKQAERISLTISDTGIGIAASERLKIFDPFYRIDRDRQRQTGGTGLGLAIVKSIADLYDAKLQIHSQIGCGTTFAINFACINEPSARSTKNHL